MTPALWIAAGSLCAGFCAGFALEHTIKSAEIAAIKLDDAQAITQASQVALADYKAGADAIKLAAGGAQTDLTAITAQLATIRRNQKNAPPPPLPPGCKPGAVRLRNLADTASAADKAIAGPAAGK